jgi:hypothetical protein
MPRRIKITKCAGQAFSNILFYVGSPKIIYIPMRINTHDKETKTNKKQLVANRYCSNIANCWTKKFLQFFEVHLEYFTVCQNLFIPRFFAEALMMFCETLGVQEILPGGGCSVKRTGHYIRHCLFLTGYSNKRGDFM